jgi:photosystem II stability/assembly factor-like uncharacterized protein
MKNKHNLISKALLILLLTVSSLADAQQWQELDTGVTEDLYDVCCIDANTLFVCGQNGVILKSEDGGNSWQEKYRNEGFYLYDLCFVDDEIGFAYGDFLVKTSDGGNSWVLIDTQYPEEEKSLFEKNDGVFYNIVRMQAIDADTLYFVSSLGWLSKSTDGGITASYVLNDYEYYMPEEEGNNCRLFFENNVGYIVYVSERVEVYKTNNFGGSWERVFEVESGDFQDHVLVHFLNKDEIKLFGAPDTELFLYFDNVICTNDGFSSTMSEKSYTDHWAFSYFRDSKFTSPDNGCYISKTGLYGDGYCYSAITNDGGLHWKYCANGISDEFDVYGVDGIDTMYYLVAEKGIVYRMKSGATQLNELLELLVSIYPNPGNNLLKISGRNISIVELYSVIGTCLEKKQGIDADETIIDIHNYDSGIYYVRIIDGQGKSITKKLIKY